MESLIPIFRMMHFLGLALLLGGTLCSIILMRKEQTSTKAAQIAWNCIHFIASPGLLLLLITGIFQSSAMYWEHFKGAGYMHAKVVLVFGILLLMIADMRTQKNVIKNNSDADALMDTLKKRQVLAMGSCALVFMIMWLVSFRPF